ncbi:MAG: hypothetical protein WA057_05540 [Candidatus Magasanikiibacteriota bacterium]
MAKIFKLFFIGLFVIVLSGCVSQPIQKDFSFEYNWFGKMVPAPEHNEYIISVSPDGKGKLLYYADYSIKSVEEDKLWKREFTVSLEQMKQTYQEMNSRNVFNDKNLAEDKVNVRENYGDLVVQVDKVKHFININDTSDTSVKELEQIVKKVVPNNIWAEMDAKIELDKSKNNDVLDYELPELQY